MDLVKTGAFLKELRKEKNITQEELAEQMGVSRRTVSRWETGSNMPDMDVLIDISDFYDLTCIHDIYVIRHLSHNAKIVRNKNDPHSELVFKVVHQLKYLCLNGNIKS